MPYIIATYLPGGCLDPIGAGQEPDTQRAVATVEEARAAIKAFCDNRYAFYGHDADALVIESGGIVGPLPDGTVIEVRPLSWLSLFHEADRRAVRLNPDASHEAIVASYNALQGEAS